MTQREQVLALVSRPGGACIESFLHARIPRYSARIFELRRAGKTIVEQPCERHDHARKTPAWVLAENTGGTYTVTSDGYTSASIPFDASATKTASLF